VDRRTTLEMRGPLHMRLGTTLESVQDRMEELVEEERQLTGICRPESLSSGRIISVFQYVCDCVASYRSVRSACLLSVCCPLCVCLSVFSFMICLPVRVRLCRQLQLDNTVVILLLHCCYTVVTLLLHCCYTVVILLSYCCYTVVTMLLCVVQYVCDCVASYRSERLLVIRFVCEEKFHILRERYRSVSLNLFLRQCMYDVISVCSQVLTLRTLSVTTV
jgi:hypothetical protein